MAKRRRYSALRVLNLQTEFFIIQDSPQRRLDLGRVAAPAIAPAATNGDRLFGRPMTSAGIPSTPASSATVEFTVTTTCSRRAGARAARRQGER